MTEWGWFIAEIFHRDPDASFGLYKNQVDFDEKTHYMFVMDAE